MGEGDVGLAALSPCWSALYLPCGWGQARHPHTSPVPPNGPVGMAIPTLLVRQAAFVCAVPQRFARYLSSWTSSVGQWRRNLGLPALCSPAARQCV